MGPQGNRTGGQHARRELSLGKGSAGYQMAWDMLLMTEFADCRVTS
jgi:hypothetical protein